MSEQPTKIGAYRLAVMDRLSVLGHVDVFLSAIAGSGAELQVSIDDRDGRQEVRITVVTVAPALTTEPPRLIGAEEVIGIDRDVGPDPIEVTMPREDPVTDPKPDPKNRKGEPWTPAEDTTFIAMKAAGRSTKEVAAELGRPEPGCHYRWKTKLSKQAPPPPETKRPVPSPAEPEARPRIPATAPADVRQAAAHWQSIETDDWGAATDLFLIEQHTGGQSVQDVADQLGVVKSEAVARWNALFPERSLAAQQSMLAALRMISATEEGETP